MKKIFQNLGLTVFIRGITQFSEKNAESCAEEVKNFKHFIMEENISLIIAVNAYRTAPIMPLLNVNYWILLAGTDMNIFAKEPQNQAKIYT